MEKNKNNEKSEVYWVEDNQIPMAFEIWRFKFNLTVLTVKYNIQVTNKRSSWLADYVITSKF